MAKRKGIKPRGEVRRSRKPEIVAGTAYLESGGFEIGAWCPDEAGKAPPEQVHLLIKIEGLPAPILMRFKSPDTLGFLIEELARYRLTVWPNAEPSVMSE